MKVCPTNRLRTIKVDGKLVYSEVYVWKDLMHKNIVRLYEHRLVNHGDQLVMVTVYMEGGELFDRIVDHRP